MFRNRISIEAVFCFAVLIAIGVGLAAVPALAQETDLVREQVFREADRLVAEAEAADAHMLAPKNFAKGMEYYRKALRRYERQGKLKDIHRDLERAKEYLYLSVDSAKITRMALARPLAMRALLEDRQLDEQAPRQFSRAEDELQDVIKGAEDGDLRSLHARIAKLEDLYRKVATAAYQGEVLDQARAGLDKQRGQLGRQKHRASVKELDGIKDWVRDQERTGFELADFLALADARIAAVVDILLPEFYRNLPDSLTLGDFVLRVISYQDKGHWSFAEEAAIGVSGLAEVRFHCGLTLMPVFPSGLQVIQQNFVVVETVSDPTTEISTIEAQRLDLDLVVGDEVTLPLAVEKVARDDILAARDDVLGLLEPLIGPGGIMVRFADATIRPSGRPTMGLMTAGSAAYPTDPPWPDIPAEIHVAGFTVQMDSLYITPNEAITWARIALPRSIVDGAGCGPAVLEIGEVAITADCQLYKEMPHAEFGPFIIDKTGMVFRGRGYVVDLDLSVSPPGLGLAASWRGVVLERGATIPLASGTVTANSGYLAADYRFTDGLVTAPGLQARFVLNDRYEFASMIPYGYEIRLGSGYVDVDSSAVAGGQFADGTIELPVRAACDGAAGGVLKAAFTSLAVQDDMDLAGQVTFVNQIFWGELTRNGRETIHFAARPDPSHPDHAYFYLSGKASERHVPKSTADFTSVSWWGDIPTKLEQHNLPGVTLLRIREFTAFTPDVPGGPPKEMVFKHGSGVSLVGTWLNVETLGINGTIFIRPEPSRHQELGDPTVTYYKGGIPFQAELQCVRDKQSCLGVRFSSSAVFDSGLQGILKLGGPCNAQIPFEELEFTSTASLVGGDIDLSGGPVTLEYWGVELVEAIPGEPAGVLSVKTGQIILTQAGIQEPRHFGQPFKLIWGEMLADGNLGELFFDYNTGTQKFDGFSFTPHHIALSKWPDGPDGYLQVCGDNHFNFFGSSYLHIRDYRYTGPDPNGFYGGRNIDLVEPAAESCDPSDLNLHKTWGSALSTFDFDIVYDEDDQDGFLGEGTVALPEHFGNTVDASIQIDHSYMCIGLMGSASNSFLLAGVNMGQSAELWGCITIDGNTLSCITVGFTLAQTADAGLGILGGAGTMIEAKLVITPTVTTFSAAGMMYMDLSLGGNVTVDGSILLQADRAAMSIYGDFQGNFDFGSLAAGLKANGPVNWYLSPVTQYLQGRAGIELWGRSLGSGGVAGGIFVGHNVPKDEVWVFTDTSNKYALNTISMPDDITGVYGFGQISYGQDFGIFSGGIEIYGAIGAFINMTGIPFDEVGGLPLPYIVGNFGVSLHGEILWGVVSASAWVNLQFGVGNPFFFQGTAGLEGCVLWVICASVDVTVRLDETGFHIY